MYLLCLKIKIKMIKFESFSKIEWWIIIEKTHLFDGILEGLNQAQVKHMPKLIMMLD